MCCSAVTAWVVSCHKEELYEDGMVASSGWANNGSYQLCLAPLASLASSTQLLEAWITFKN